MKKILKLLGLGLFFMGAVQAQTIKVAVLAPEGTSWASNMEDMAKEIKKVTNGEVNIRLYLGGTQGDEHDVLRKVRVGQLQGGIFTGKTLGDINGDVRVIEIPFNFDGDSKKAMGAVKELAPDFNKGFIEKGFENLGFFEIGNVYFVSNKEFTDLASLKGMKIWAWEGDKLVSSMIDAMGLVSVPLPITDVLSSLSSGIVEAAYAPPLGIIALQWSSRINYILDLPISFSVGAFLVESKTWKKISEANRVKIKKVSEKYVELVNKGNTRDNEEAKQVLQSMGVEFVSFPESDVKKSKELRKEMVKRLKGNLFSEEVYQKLEAYRNK
jgi:TRAP-type C4-dicarboxylate transport system substrate-binding protein